MVFSTYTPKGGQSDLIKTKALSSNDRATKS